MQVVKEFEVEKNVVLIIYPLDLGLGPSSLRPLGCVLFVFLFFFLNEYMVFCFPIHQKKKKKRWTRNTLFFLGEECSLKKGEVEFTFHIWSTSNGALVRKELLLISR